MSVEEIRDSLDHPRCVDPDQLLVLPTSLNLLILRLALEVFHDIQEAIVHIRMIAKANLDLVQVAQRIVEDGLLSLRQLGSHRHGRRTPSKKRWRYLLRWGWPAERLRLHE